MQILRPSPPESEKLAIHQLPELRYSEQSLGSGRAVGEADDHPPPRF